MSQFLIRPVTAGEVFDSPAFAALVAEYRAESLRNPDVTGSVPDRALYEQMADAGLLHGLGVFVCEQLVGFCGVIITPMPHHAGKTVASTEVLFIAKAHRAGGAGLSLLRAAEGVAQSAGAIGLYVSAPVEGALTRVLPRAGYRETNRVFYRGAK